MVDSTAILMLHGFAGNFGEISRLFNMLLDMGYVVECPTLAGHGGSKKDLSKTRYTDWIRSSIDSYSKLRENYDKVVVIGFSMGGLVAVNLFELMPYNLLVTINTPIYYWNPKEISRNIKDNFFINSKKYIKTSIDKPVSSLFEFLKILNISKGKFEKITCPSLIIQAKNDDTVRPKSARYIYENVNGNKQMHYFESGGHLILKSDNVTKISALVDECIKNEVKK
jgi:carboxylesterase